MVAAAAAAWGSELGGAEVVVDFGEGRPGAEHAVAAELDPSRLPDRRFIGLFQDRFDREPGPYAAYGYEAMAFALQAIGAANTNSDQFRSEVRDGVIGGERRESVLGPYSITDEGDSTVCMVQRYLVSGAQPQPLDAPCPPNARCSDHARVLRRSNPIDRWEQTRLQARPNCDSPAITEATHLLISGSSSGSIECWIRLSR